MHADLIVGLPGETWDSFAAGFDRLVGLGPHEIQVGILKRLRGTPIIRHDAEWQMVYSPHPPYEILSSKLLSFAQIQELRRLGKYWDAVANSGNFVQTLPLIWKEATSANDPEGLIEQGTSPFEEFRRLAAWLFERERKTHGIPLSRYVELLFEYLRDIKGMISDDVAVVLWTDYQRGGRSDKPHCLRPFIDRSALASPDPNGKESRGPKRQARHWQT